MQIRARQGILAGVHGAHGLGVASCRLVVVTAAIVGLLAVVPAAGATRRHHPPPRPDLIVASGTVGVLNGRVHGSFTVTDSGDAKAPPSTAALRISGKGRSRSLRSYAVHSLKAGQGQTIRVSTSLPLSVAAGSYRVTACADADHTVRERSESNDCMSVGSFTVTASTSPTKPVTIPTPTPGQPTSPPSPTSPTAPTTPAAPASTVPTAPISYQVNTPEDITDSQGDYWVDVPPSYDASNQTPETLLVWMHGCGGEAEGDAYEVSPGDDRSYIAISIGGREDDCWDPDTDVPKVLSGVADVKTHFNIDPRRVIIAGYSSGGDLAYRTIFYNAGLFAGILAENTSPFRDTGSTASQSLAAATWKFNDVHLAHLQDDTYPIDGVQDEITQMQNAGFPVTLIEEPGDHYDDDNDVNDTGTDNDLRHYLLPHINDGWLSPG
jgi:predicted esterase